MRKGKKVIDRKLGRKLIEDSLFFKHSNYELNIVLKKLCVVSKGQHCTLKMKTSD